MPNDRRVDDSGVLAKPSEGPLDCDRAEWVDFEAAARRPIEQHIRNSFIETYKPVLDDAEYRSFETMQEYRQWCKDNLPDWLGFNRA